MRWKRSSAQSQEANMTDTTAQAAMIGALSNKIEDAIWDSAPEGTFSYGSNASAIVSDMAKASAAAVLALVGPLPLVWDHPDQKLMYSKGGSLLLTMFTSPQDGVRMWRLGLRGKSEYQWFDEDRLDLAQAAAQSQRAAEHWSGTPLGDLIAATHTSQQTPADGTEESMARYRRADLPPTLAAALELPEIKALVEALTDMRELFSADGLLLKGTHLNATLRLAEIALAQLKEPKP
jgi:hypothetical protein